MPDEQILMLFPNLTPDSFTITSPATRLYNCIAWAAGKSDDWWWPAADSDFGFWPDEVERKPTLGNFTKAYELLGFECCDDDQAESGIEKVAIYTDANGVPTHAARQLPSGRWTSKLGKLEDIEHATLDGVSGDIYGTATVIMKRPARD
jgi:hypothetical protein